ncbi:MAG: cytochrome c-type biogenesis protein CcmH [Alphaproteobacteria bacterium]|nr:cytochrome c-type biogenesis protein CcmH [Alphaproteobacteria bacterium]
MNRLAAAVVGLSITATVAHAVLPNEQLSDPKLESRARAISQELRCVVCQNQTIDDSDADLAHDLRVLLRERLLKGDSDEQAKAFLVKRYGTYVLLQPPFRPETLVLWLGPLLVLIAGGMGAGIYLSRRRPQTAEALSAEEENQVAALLGGQGR